MAKAPKPVPDSIANVTIMGRTPILTYRLVTGGWIRAMIAKWFIRPEAIAVPCSVCNYRETPDHVQVDLYTVNSDEIPIRLSKEEAYRFARRILRDQEVKKATGAPTASAPQEEQDSLVEQIKAFGTGPIDYIGGQPKAV